MADAGKALNELAIQLRGEGSVISPHVRDPDGEVPGLGMLVAGGPRAADAPAEYAILFESIREGYLLHYADARVVNGADDDLALLAGDYLYARGLERLAGLGDLEAVRELSDLISLAAQLHAANHGSPTPTTVPGPCGWPRRSRSRPVLRPGTTMPSGPCVMGIPPRRGPFGRALPRWPRRPASPSDWAGPPSR